MTSQGTIPGLQVDLTGQVAVVTGASQGLGEAIAVALGASGATVICVARNAEKLTKTVAAIQALGGTPRRSSVMSRTGSGSIS